MNKELSDYLVIATNYFNRVMDQLIFEEELFNGAYKKEIIIERNQFLADFKLLLSYKCYILKEDVKVLDDYLSNLFRSY